MSRNAIRCLVEGRVQGVFYRASTAEKAASLSVDGWVRNLPDGRVEVVIAGEPAAVERLTAWLWEGPSGALVTAVAVEEFAEPVGSGFRVER